MLTLLAFESGFLSIESGDIMAVMRATGEWHGRATFSPEVLRALGVCAAEGSKNARKKVDRSESRRSDFLETAKGSRTPEIAYFFSSRLLPRRLLAAFPPAADPITIAYADGHFLIGNMTIPCQWHLVSEALIRDLENPDLMDLLALERTIPRAELKGSPLGRRIMDAMKWAEQRIKKATAQLADLDVTEEDIRLMVEKKLAARMEPRSS